MEGWRTRDFQTVLSLCVGALGGAGGASRHQQVHMRWLMATAVFPRTPGQRPAPIHPDQADTSVSESDLDLQVVVT